MYSEYGSPIFLLSGLGMILVGFGAIVYWRLRTKSSLKWFLYGGVLWAFGAGVKFAMDLTVSGLLQTWFLTSYTSSLWAVFWGLVVGVRTGFFESGFTYLAVVKYRWDAMGWEEALGFGVGFGGSEAMAVGLISLLNVLMLLANPEMIHTLPQAQQEAIRQQFSLGLALIPAPVLERLFTMFIHVFASLLVVYAVKLEKPGYFLTSFMLKGVLDGVIPWLTSQVNLSTVGGLYAIESYVMALGLLSLLGIRGIRKRVKGVIDRRSLQGPVD